MGSGPPGFPPDAFRDPQPDLGFVADGLAFGNALDDGELGEIEKQGGGLLAAQVALADLAPLGRRELERANGLELVPNFGNRMGVPVSRLFFLRRKLGKGELGWRKIAHLTSDGTAGARSGPCREP